MPMATGAPPIKMSIARSAGYQAPMRLEREPAKETAPAADSSDNSSGMAIDGDDGWGPGSNPSAASYHIPAKLTDEEFARRFAELKTLRSRPPFSLARRSRSRSSSRRPVATCSADIGLEGAIPASNAAEAKATSNREVGVGGDDVPVPDGENIPIVVQVRGAAAVAADHANDHGDRMPEQPLQQPVKPTHQEIWSKALGRRADDVVSKVPFAKSIQVRAKSLESGRR